MISIIVPAFNAEKNISNCLKSLLDQAIDAQEVEIIVVDDGSTDSTPDIVKRYPQVKLISQQNQGPATARNNGAKQARGEIILFTDSDCQISTNWIEEMAKPLESNRDIVGTKGIYKTAQKQIIARFVQLEYEDKYDVMNRHKYIDFIDTYSAGFVKKRFLEIGGYDESFPLACAEDIELSFRLANAGYKMVFVPTAVVQHIHPDKLMAYFKKKYKFAYWRMLALKKNPNKIAKDSHTPQIMKLQVLLIPVIVLSVVAGIVFKSYVMPLTTILIYFATTIPFCLKAAKKDLAVALLSVPLLFVRSIAQFLGIMFGIFNNFS